MSPAERQRRSRAARAQREGPRPTRAPQDAEAAAELQRLRQRHAEAQAEIERLRQMERSFSAAARTVTVIDPGLHKKLCKLLHPDSAPGDEPRQKVLNALFVKYQDALDTAGKGTERARLKREADLMRKRAEQRARNSARSKAAWARRKGTAEAAE